MTTLPPIEPGDLIDVVVRLRTVVGALDDCAFALNASFARVSPEIEAEAVKMRHTLQLGASRVVAVLKLIEDHEIYIKSRSTTTSTVTSEEP